MFLKDGAIVSGEAFIRSTGKAKLIYRDFKRKKIKN